MASPGAAQRRAAQRRAELWIRCARADGRRRRRADADAPSTDTTRRRRRRGEGESPRPLAFASTPRKDAPTQDPPRQLDPTGLLEFLSAAPRPRLDPDAHHRLLACAEHRGPAVLRRLHAIDATRVHQTRSWVVYFSILGPFGPRSTGDVPRRRLGLVSTTTKMVKCALGLCGPVEGLPEGSVHVEGERDFTGIKK